MFTRVRRWMSAPPVVVAARTPVGEAQRIMEERQIQHLPVLDGDYLVGIVSDTAVALGLPSAAMRSRPPETNRFGSHPTVSDVMMPAPVTVGPDQRAAEAARLMLARRITALPVLERGRLVGIVTATDLLSRWARC